MKLLVIRFLQWIFSNPAYFIKIKDTAFCNPSEHLYRTVHFIRIHQLDNFASQIIDIGAADGGTCSYFAREFPLHKIIGFEPVVSSFQSAALRTKHNLNVTLRPVALSERIGESTVYVTKDSLASSLNEVNYEALKEESSSYSSKFKTIHSQPTKLSTLDREIGSEKVLLIKIDTQGTELAILRGGYSVIRRTKLILIELNNHYFYKDSCQYYEVDEFLRQQGFTLKDIFVIYRANGDVKEYDALYMNNNI